MPVQSAVSGKEKRGVMHEGMGPNWNEPEVPVYTSLVCPLRAVLYGRGQNLGDSVVYTHQCPMLISTAGFFAGYHVQGEKTNVSC